MGIVLQTIVTNTFSCQMVKLLALLAHLYANLFEQIARIQVISSCKSPFLIELDQDPVL